MLCQGCTRIHRGSNVNVTNDWKITRCIWPLLWSKSLFSCRGRASLCGSNWPIQTQPLPAKLRHSLRSQESVYVVQQAIIPATVTCLVSAEELNLCQAHRDHLVAHRSGIHLAEVLAVANQPCFWWFVSECLFVARTTELVTRHVVHMYTNAS
ncbi:hypothetical protein FIBSPDRAFT_392275 [Athelia psychrophila]|uniref:Uncharacterized protein n=1 Tax=Athelia psychrophila TaxID=1759441 RepID=A0A167V4A0_9AGAM|nr:hypothetical protein FIBSPDRAFT_392275 [Fibularhizoctonia sp. CBS 109695]